MLRTVKIMASVAIFFVALSSSAQVTTSALSGVVTDENQQAMIGATITALHAPPNTKCNAVTNNYDRCTIQSVTFGGSNLDDGTQALPAVNNQNGCVTLSQPLILLFVLIFVFVVIIIFIIIIIAVLKDKNVMMKLTGKGLGFFIEIFSKKEDKDKDKD